MGWFAAAVVASYLLGSIPAAYLAGRWRGVDLRKHGSGNLGATNVIRVLGAKIGALVFAFDMAKGAVPVLLLPPWLLRHGAAETLPNALGSDVMLGILCGVAAIIGHVRPIYLRFGKGGKGVATAAGVFIALAPLPTVLTLVIFAVVLMSSGYVSLGSLTSASMLPILLAIVVGVRSPLFALSVLVALFVFWTHRANIARLRKGEEHRFGKRAAGATPGLGEGKRPVATLAISVVIIVSILAAARFG
ncbi:MAG TPA: glycerol-3-phosphate 1-O-acyltransferase PlsY [Gemmatimonadaceae bacterium]|jgi:glycerol-3-phosphate acyltransferase PlsY|nr:glycerol-3-phosphate 1-O-acyltransferase PlsY [Gemmatimonadaceae bacterium]